MNNFEKTPYEIISLPFKFAPVLADIETIFSYTVVCINVETEINTKPAIVDSDTAGDISVTIKIQAGTAGDCHKITVRVLTTDGNYFEIDLLLTILETITNKFKKQPGSRFCISNDFDNDIEISDSISTHSIIVTKISDGSDVTSSLLVNSLISETLIKMILQSGTDHEDYIISIRVVTTHGLQYEKLILMSVRER